MSVTDALTAGIFAKPNPFVTEAYSEPGQEALVFSSAEALATFMQRQMAQPRGYVFLFVAYPDMLGAPIPKRINLTRPESPERHFRYTWEGWGLISVQLHGPGQPVPSHISSNSATRAQTWSATHPEWHSPDEWDWKAVERHTRRLQRILRSAK